MTGRKAALLLSAALAFVAAAGGAEAKRFDLLHTFRGKDGARPIAAPIMDTAGNIYGTTADGGSANHGTVYRIATDGNASLLADFANKAGMMPISTLMLDKDGKLFGTTSEAHHYSVGGTVFEIGTKSRLRVLHVFHKGDATGTTPRGALVEDTAGNLYGTTDTAVFKLAPDGTISVLHAFDFNHGDGSDPVGDPIMDASGNIYGVTSMGGPSQGGTVYKIAPDGSETILHSFDPRLEGFNPQGGVVMDVAGNFYGTLSEGGDHGGGTVYKLAPDGALITLHNFNDYIDGTTPMGSLVAGASGHFYGTTSTGARNGSGTVFEIHGDGRFRTLHLFDTLTPHEHNGLQPQAGLFRDAAGNLYGTTSRGGGRSGVPASGTLFKIAAQ